MISLSALKKLHRFLMKGGIAIALIQLPATTANPSELENLERLIDHMWLDEEASSVTVYRPGKNGGIGYYISNLENFDIGIPEIGNSLNVKTTCSGGGVIHTLRECEDKYILFMMNTGQERENDVRIQSSYMGEPFYWDYESSRERSLPFWDFTTDRKEMIIHIQLDAGQSKLILIRKTDPEEAVHISNCQMDGIDRLLLTDDQCQVKGWQRASGKYELSLHKGHKTIQLEYTVSTKLPILKVSPKNWFLEAEKHGSIDLGDYSKSDPHHYQPLIYHKLIMIDEKYCDNQKLVLKLGKLNHWCQIYINDQMVGQAIFKPWSFDITPYIKAGENKISIRVIGNLSNLMAAEFNRSHMEFPVLAYGLFGPVTMTPYGIVTLGDE